MLSIMSFTGKIENTFASSIGIAILGVVGYVSHTEGSLIQNHSTNLALFAMTTIVPAIGYLLMLIPIHFYNITGEGHRKMMSEIAERRASIAAETAAEMQSAGRQNEPTLRFHSRYPPLLAHPVRRRRGICLPQRIGSEVPRRDGRDNRRGFDKILEDPPAAVMIAGDLSDDGERICHEEFREKLRELQKHVPVYVITATHAGAVTRIHADSRAAKSQTTLRQSRTRS